MNTNADLLRELRIDRSSGPPPSRKGLWIALAAIAVALAMAAVGWWLFARDKPVPVQTATAVPLSAGSAPASVLDASGYVVARRMATVSAKITGRVREVLIEEGMQVEEGQVMARLDPIDADAQRTLSASQLAAARSEIARVQAQLAEAEANARRLGALVGQQLVSKAQHDQAVATRDALRAQMESARRNAKVASDGLHIADLGVDNTVVRAPFAGVVIAKAALHIFLIEGAESICLPFGAVYAVEGICFGELHGFEGFSAGAWNDAVVLRLCLIDQGLPLLLRLVYRVE